jgi:hypothetical protein
MLAKKNEAKEKRNKAHKFARIVQEIYWSKERKQAEKKVKEEMDLRKKMQHQKVPEPEKPKVINYLHYFSNQNLPKKKQKAIISSNKSSNRLPNASVNTSTPHKRPPLPDYLKEIRQKRQLKNQTILSTNNSKLFLIPRQFHPYCSITT